MASQSNYGSHDSLHSDADELTAQAKRNNKSFSETTLTSNDNTGPSEPEENTLLYSTTSSARNDERWYNRPSIPIICVLMFLLCLSDMLFFTPNVGLTMTKVCTHLNDENIEDPEYQCDPAEVQVIVSEITSATLIISGVITTGTSMKWGGVSDRIGRVRALAYMGTIKVIGNLLHTLALLPSSPYSRWLIILTSCINAFTGGTFAFMATANSYVSDVTKQKDRTVQLSVVLSIMHATMGIGPMLSSFLIKFSDGRDQVPLFGSIAIGAIFTLLCFTLVREPRTEESRLKSQSEHDKHLQQMQEKKKSMVSDADNSKEKILAYTKYYAIEIFGLYKPMKKLWLKPTETGSLIPRYTVILLLALDLLSMSATIAMGPALILFATYRYNWRSVELGYLVSLLGILRSLMLVVLAPLLLKLLKKKFTALDRSVDNVDIISLRGSMICIFIGLCCMIRWNKHFQAIILYGFFASLGAIDSPTIQSTIIKYCSKNNTGEYFGGIALIRSFAMFVIPPLLLKIYASTVETKPELFFYVPLVSIAIAIFLTMFLGVHEEEQYSDSDVMSIDTTTDGMD